MAPGARILIYKEEEGNPSHGGWVGSSVAKEKKRGDPHTHCALCFPGKERPVREKLLAMNRRTFFSLLGAGAVAADPERLLWVPGAKTISIPRPALPVMFSVGDVVTFAGDPVTWCVISVCEDPRTHCTIEPVRPPELVCSEVLRTSPITGPKWPRVKWAQSRDAKLRRDAFFRTAPDLSSFVGPAGPPWRPGRG
jgi:hypothetical protein